MNADLGDVTWNEKKGRENKLYLKPLDQVYLPEWDAKSNLNYCENDQSHLTKTCLMKNTAQDISIDILMCFQPIIEKNSFKWKRCCVRTKLKNFPINKSLGYCKEIQKTFMKRQYLEKNRRLKPFRNFQWESFSDTHYWLTEVGPKHLNTLISK